MYSLVVIYVVNTVFDFMICQIFDISIRASRVPQSVNHRCDGQDKRLKFGNTKHCIFSLRVEISAGKIGFDEKG